MDESLQLLPAAETLDLSRNKFFKVDNLQNWKCSKLKHLDLGFNNLRSIASFSEVLDQILHTKRFLILNDQKQQIESLLENLEVLLNFLQKSSQNSSEEVKSLEIKIRDGAYQAEDEIESCISSYHLSQYESHLQELHPMFSNRIFGVTLDTGMQKVVTEIDSTMEESLPVEIAGLRRTITEMNMFRKEMLEIKDGSGEQSLQPRNCLPSKPAPSGQTTMVGFGEDFMQIRDRLCGDQESKLQIIPIVGMGGVGKTTLAMSVYNDSFVAYHFYICAWVRLSQQYGIREILLSLLDDIGVLTEEKRKESNEQLKELIYKSVKGKRFLIVVDDVWSTSAWNHIRMLFPDDNNGSRLLLTTRLTDVADYASSSNTHHLMRFLTEKESWNLFCHKVFGKANCPSELVDVGMNIAKNCRGLPLSIVVIGGLLSKVNMEQEYWEYVAVNLSSIIAEKDDHCLEVLTLSYNNLPPYLKPCFLYMGVFPENYEIPVSRLVKLWVAEGFVNPCKTEHADNVAEKYLMELISRNLIMVDQKGSINGKIKTCRIHDLLRELCVRMAHGENFLYVKSRYLHMIPEMESFKRRLSIHDDASYTGSEEDIAMETMHLVRSFIYNGWDDTGLHSYYYFGCRLLRVLDMLGVELRSFPEEILQLVNLRYIAIACHAQIPASISILWNLQTLIVEDPTELASELPLKIWNMPQLRHLKFSRVLLPPFYFNPLARSYFFLGNLETLSVLDNFDYDISNRIPNLKKLGIHYNPKSAHSLYQFARLKKLESLKILFDSPADFSFIRRIVFPSRLKKITLERGRIDWQYMKIFGLLPNLEVLKLRDFAFRGPDWLPSIGQFLKLKFLLIWETDLENWSADNTHFPNLEHLILRNCSNLVEIPSGIGEILTLEIIEIDCASPSAMASAKKILDDQRSLGNDGFQVFVHPTKTKVYPVKFGIQQDLSGLLYRRETKLEEFKAKVKSGSSSKS